MVKTLNFSSENLLSVDYIWTVLYIIFRDEAVLASIFAADSEAEAEVGAPGPRAEAAAWASGTPVAPSSASFKSRTAPFPLFFGRLENHPNSEGMAAVRGEDQPNESLSTRPAACRPNHLHVSQNWSRLHDR